MNEPVLSLLLLQLSLAGRLTRNQDDEPARHPRRWLAAAAAAAATAERLVRFFTRQRARRRRASPRGRAISKSARYWWLCRYETR